MNPKVDEYLHGAGKRCSELAELRRIALACGLSEELKWGAPCYTSHEKNIILLGALKEHCVLSFPKGSLLSDTHHLLSKPGENTRAARVIRFSSLAEIRTTEHRLTEMIHEAIAIENSGLKVDTKQDPELALPEELQTAMTEKTALKAAFQKLTPGRRRAYVLHISQPKQSATRSSRIEKCLPRILCGKGLNDCTCGLSKKMPTCDGSHKFAI